MKMLRRRCFCLLLLIMLTVSGMGHAAHVTLSYRDSGDAVLKMQQALNVLGYGTGGMDGKFGPTTEKAVRQFQKDNKLAVDGKAGNKTLTLLYQKAEGTAADTAISGSLQYGTQGAEVLKMQKALMALGYNTGGADGKYGPTTRTAVSSFQKDHGLSVDGIAGKKTLEKLYAQEGNGQSTGETSAKDTTVTLSYGSWGDKVKTLQQALKDLGYLTGSVDGHYGNQTLLAVKAFQKANGLSADGIAGPKTLKKLYGGSAESSQTQTETKPAQTNYDTLRTGDTGDRVKQLQQALKDLGYLTGSVDDKYGTATQKAVKTFQDQNGLTADGVAGKNTLKKLYGGSAKAYVPPKELNSTTTSVSVPGKGELQLLHWFNQVKPSIKSGQKILVYEPESGLSWTLRLYSLGRHADSEPLTKEDTDAMYKAFGNKNTWTQKPVYVQLPDGRWTLASTHNMPHLSGSIKDNGFDGHLCVHFLRDMSECTQNDPKYGVANQNTIRSAWKKLTGETIK